MFRAGNPFGIDLASLNIQRGRDHGLRPYNDYRELVGLPRLKHFEELSPEVGRQSLMSLFT
jgi:peroxidase